MNYPSIILFPHKYGQKKEGVDLAPAAFAKHIKTMATPNIISCSDDFFQNINKLYNQDLMHLQAVSKNNDLLSGKLFNIGGDHSMAIASVAATLSVYPDAKILWIDAHPDLNTFEKSPSKNYHGMPLGIVSGLDKDVEKFPFLNENNRLDLSKNLLYIGIREIDHFESDMIKNYNIPYITVKEFQNNVDDSIKKIINWVDGYPVHVSFDVDAIDPKEIPCTGTAVSEGLSTSDVKSIMDSLLQSKEYIVNIDIAELNIALCTEDEQNKSLCNVLSIFSDYMKS